MKIEFGSTTGRITITPIKGFIIERDATPEQRKAIHDLAREVAQAAAMDRYEAALAADKSRVDQVISLAFPQPKSVQLARLAAQYGVPVIDTTLQ